MAKEVWISFPLITTTDLKDESVVTFLKGGLKKELEVETAAFLTKWLMDKDVPFGVDFDSSGVDRSLVIESLPKRLQKILAPVIAEPVVVPVGEAVKQVEDAGSVEEVTVAEEATDVEEAADVEQGGATEKVAEFPDVAAELPSGDADSDGPSELR